MNKIFFFLIQFLLFAQLAFTADKYCDYTNGDDANDCSNGTTQLCKTLQRCVNIAIGGDTINIANTSAQILTAAITWNTGFTASANLSTIFQAWDNGGAITIQRPDEAVARVGAIIDGDGLAFNSFSITSFPSHAVFKNIKFQGMTDVYLRTTDFAIVSGCEFDGTGAGAALLRNEGGNSKAYNNYIHSFTLNASTVRAGGYFFNNYIDSTATSTDGQVYAMRAAKITGNIIIVNGGNVAFGKNQREVEFVNNTIISDGSANAIGYDNASGFDSSLYNNIFYNFDGAGAKPVSLSGTQRQRMWGNNAFYDSNAQDLPTEIGLDLTANDITGIGDPFVDSANDDYTLTVASGARGEALSNPNSSLDIGAVQSASTGGGGGGSNKFIFLPE